MSYRHQTQDGILPGTPCYASVYPVTKNKLSSRQFHYTNLYKTYNNIVVLKDYALYAINLSKPCYLQDIYLR